MIRQSVELQTGKAGEYLVCADLILNGFVAFLSEQGLPYDVLLDTGERLLKIQVKTTSGPRVVPQRTKETKAYIFNIKRRGKNGKSVYSANEVDLFALVCLDTRKIGYVKPIDMPDTLNLRVDSLKGQYYDEKGVLDSEKAKELHKSITNKSEVAREMGLCVSQVHRYLTDGHKPYITNARYFSDIERKPEWFIENF